MPKFAIFSAIILQYSHFLPTIFWRNFCLYIATFWSKSSLFTAIVWWNSHFSTVFSEICFFFSANFWQNLYIFLLPFDKICVYIAILDLIFFLFQPSNKNDFYRIICWILWLIGKILDIFLWPIIKISFSFPRSFNEIWYFFISNNEFRKKLLVDNPENQSTLTQE